MAPEGNEYKQRQQQRAEARKQRELAHKRMMFRLGLAAAVVIACGLLIWLVASESRAPGSSISNTQPDPEQTTASLDTTAPPVKEDRTQISIAVAGDLNINDATVAAGNTPSGYDYTNVFMDVAPLLANADITVLNLEGNLCGAPYGTQNASAPQELMTTLADLGVDLVQLANSYSIQNGLLGLDSTIDGVRAAGLEPVGVYATEQDFRDGQGYTIKEIDGIRVAFVAFTKGMNNLGLPAGSENCVNVLYTDYATTYQDVDEDKINRILRAASNAEPDYIVALLHWGSEYNDEYSETQEEIRDLLFAGGVDAIVGTHPHRVQAVEFDRDAGTFVAYSLGDFFSDTVEAGSNYSVVLNLQITKDNLSGETKLTGYTCTPIYNMTPEESGETTLRLVRTKTAMESFEIGIFNRVSQELYDSMVYTVSRIESRLNGEG